MGMTIKLNLKGSENELDKFPTKEWKMGMTIDEDILVELFKESKMPIDKAIETIVYIASRRRNILNHLEREACANAIDTMRKYQKIQEIVKHWACCGNPSDTMMAISEVLEDGNDD